MNESLKDKTFKGVFWSVSGKVTLQAIQFFIGIIIARILNPSDYGLIGMLSIFFAFSQAFIDSGFSTALIRKQESKDVDFSTVFFFNLFISVLFYILFYFSAEYIANFYAMPELELVTKIVSINLIINSLSTIQLTILTIKVDFKRIMLSSVISSVFAGIVGVTMAYLKYGYWALVVQSIIGAILNSLILWFLSDWRPKFIFSVSAFKELFDFGSKLLFARLIGTIYVNLYTLIIGKKFSAEALGLYSRADQLAGYPLMSLSNALESVTFPILSSIQDDKAKLSLAYRKYISLTAFVVFPVTVGCIVIAKPLIISVLTAKWLGAVLLFQIACLNFVWDPFTMINLNLLKVVGRSDLVLRLEIIKKSIGFTILILTIKYGIIAICIGRSVYSLIALFINMHYTYRIINVGYFSQISEMLPSFLSSLVMGAIIYYSTMLCASSISQLLVGILIGIISYLFISVLTKSKNLKEVYVYLLEKIKIFKLNK
jgi:teichuronic acid exporter